MKNSGVKNVFSMLLMASALAVPFQAQSTQEQEKTTTTQETNKSTSAASSNSNKGNVTAGKKQKISGILVKREGNNLVVRDRSKTEYNIAVSDSTKIEERKSNPFRGARKYDAESLVRGLWVEVEGRGSDSGNLTAEKIKFTDEQYRDAASLETRVDPVEDRVGETENRMSEAEQNAQRLAGQLEELAAVANTARGGAKAAQETADKALTEVNAANERINQTNQKVAAVDEHVNAVDQRLTAVDEYEPKQTVDVNFRQGSTTLSTDAKTKLDEIAAQAKNEKGFVIQVAGFASADGGKEYNRRLSERRADAVIRYLVDNHDIPLRRIITPYGYGELKPAADNTTREGREQNRRVEVAILVSKGLSASVEAGEKSRTSTVPQQQQ